MASVTVMLALKKYPSIPFYWIYHRNVLRIVFARNLN